MVLIYVSAVLVHMRIGKCKLISFEMQIIIKIAAGNGVGKIMVGRYVIQLVSIIEPYEYFSKQEQGDNGNAT